MGLERFKPFSESEIYNPPEMGGDISAEFVDPEVFEIELMRYEIDNLTPDKEAVIDLTTILVDRQGQELSIDDKRRIRQMISVGLQEIFGSDSLTDDERSVWQTRIEPKAASERTELSGILAAQDTAEKNRYDYEMPESWQRATDEFAIMTGAETVEVPDTPAEILKEEEELSEDTVSGLGYVGISGSTDAIEVADYQEDPEADNNENNDEVIAEAEVVESYKADTHTSEDSEDENADEDYGAVANA